MDNSDNCPNKSHALVAGALDTSDVLMSEEILSAHLGRVIMGDLFRRSRSIHYQNQCRTLIMFIYYWYRISILFSQEQKYMEIFRTGYLTWFIHVIFHGSINILDICPVEGLSWIMWVFSFHISSFEQVQVVHLKLGRILTNGRSPLLITDYMMKIII